MSSFPLFWVLSSSFGCPRFWHSFGCLLPPPSHPLTPLVPHPVSPQACPQLCPPAVTPHHMDSVLTILDALESLAWGNSPSTTVALGRGCRSAAPQSAERAGRTPPGSHCRPVVAPGRAPPPGPGDPGAGGGAAPYSPMGALGPLLAGTEAGLRLGGFGPPLPTLNAPIDSLLAFTVPLGTSFLLAQGGDNSPCWDPVVVGMMWRTPKITP